MIRAVLLSKRTHWVVVICLAALHPVLLYWLQPTFGEKSNLVVLVVPALATLMFNWRVGVLFGLIEIQISGFMFNRFFGMSAAEGRPKAIMLALATAAVLFGSEHLRRFIAQRKTMEAELQQARKLEAIGRLAGGVAHDMNNTLNAIMGSVFAHRQEIAAQGRQFKDLDNIIAACERGAQLTQNLLGFARKSHYKRQTFSLNGVVESVQTLFARTANKNIQLETRLTNSPAFIRGDRGQIENAVINLCLNSLDAMGDSGTLTISTKRDKGRVSLRVKDTGIGMDASVRERAFEPFFTTKAEGKGTGLGLAMVYGVVHAMNGRIMLDSAPGKGTSVTLSFPAVAATEPDMPLPSTPPPPANAPHLLHGRTVLLIDDEPLVLRAGVRMLQTLGCEVLSATDGQDGLEKFKACEGGVHLVIVDLVMPGVNGIATIEEILRLDPSTPVLLASGYARESDEIEALKERHPAVGFLAKPYKPDQVIAAAMKTLIAPKDSVSEGPRSS
jgi:signal transduction histidine kinase/CheY-like chemotaxis protein